MKKVISLMLSLMMMISIFAVSTQSYAAEYVADSDVQSMFALVNDFRTGSDAWYWSKDDTTKVNCNLKVLNYDVNLEKIAQIRAKELIQNQSHTRPDGTKYDTCTVKDADGNTVKSSGENIIWGDSSIVTVDLAFTTWCETNYKYAGQGHRRNILSADFVSIGIAGYKADDGKTYWVQEFGKPAGAPSPAPSPAPVTPTPAKKTNTLKVTAKKPTVKYAKLKKKNQTIAVKNALNVSKAQGKVTYKRAGGSKKITVAKNGKITVKKGLKKGTYKIKIKVTAAGNSAYWPLSKTVTVKIKVK